MSNCYRRQRRIEAGKHSCSTTKCQTWLPCQRFSLRKSWTTTIKYSPSCSNSRRFSTLCRFPGASQCQTRSNSGDSVPICKLSSTDSIWRTMKWHILSQTSTITFLSRYFSPPGQYSSMDYTRLATWTLWSFCRRNSFLISLTKHCFQISKKNYTSCYKDC